MKEEVNNDSKELDSSKSKSKKLFDVIAGITILIVISIFMIDFFGELVFGSFFRHTVNGPIICFSNSSAWRYVTENNLNTYATCMIALPVILMVLGIIFCKNLEKIRGTKRSLFVLASISLVVLCLFIVLTFKLDDLSQRLRGMFLCCVLYTVWMLMFNFTYKSIIRVRELTDKK